MRRSGFFCLQLLGESLYYKLYRIYEYLRRRKDRPTQYLIVLFILFFFYNFNQARLYFNTRQKRPDDDKVIKFESVPYGNSHCVMYDYWRHDTIYDKTISFVSHMKVDQLDLLERLTRAWDGAVSIAISIPPPATNRWFTNGYADESFTKTLSLLESVGPSRLHGKASAHLFYKRSSSSPCGTVFIRQLDPGSGIISINDDSDKYPVNTARNIARIGLRTSLFLSAELEDIPCPRFEPRMRKVAYDKIRAFKKSALVFRRFEIDESESPPKTKAGLFSLYQIDKAVEYQRNLYTDAHRIPFVEDWFAVPESANGSTVFKGSIWEPLFVAHNLSVPLYDDNFVFGLRDQTSLVYEMCLENFQFHLVNDLYMFKVGIRKYLTDEETRMRQNGAVRSHNVVVTNYLARLGKKHSNLEEKCGLFRADDHFFFHVN